MLISFFLLFRENTNHWKVKKINATEQRIGGYCPLTPKEVGIFLRALGYPPSTWIYVAAGQIYGGDTHLSELRSYFPNLIFKVCCRNFIKHDRNLASNEAFMNDCTNNICIMFLQMGIETQ